jgi:stearoyl-CoA desaturase (delta-9 desaturase)
MFITSNFVGNDADAIVTEWKNMVYTVLIAYIPVLYLLRLYMARHPAINLTVPLTLWNGLVSLLACIGFVVNLWSLVALDFETSYTSVAFVRDGTSGYVLFFFRLSRLPELLCVLCRALQKKAICLLEWSHQLTVLLYCWYSLHHAPLTGYWFVQTSLAVTAIRAGTRVLSTKDRPVVGQFLLVLQIVQLAWSLVVSALYLLHPSTSYTLETLVHALATIPMDATFLYLFCTFLEREHPFQTHVNWPMCLYLGGVHLMALLGCVRCLQSDSWWVGVEVLLWYQVCAFGITAGCHRLWTHRSYKAQAPTRCILMVLASMSNQGSIYHWCRDHRLHHKESDKEGDPHNINRGFFFSHMGWLLLQKPLAVKQAGQGLDCSDLLLDPFVRLQHALNPAWDHFWCFVIPGLYGLWRLDSFWDGLLIFGALRWVLELHATWCINSVSHTFGSRPYNARPPTDNLFTALVSGGEGWHNYHHAYPYDYATAHHNWWKSPNTTKMLIDVLWVLGQTSDHRRKVF